MTLPPDLIRAVSLRALPVGFVREGDDAGPTARWTAPYALLLLASVNEPDLESTWLALEEEMEAWLASPPPGSPWRDAYLLLSLPATPKTPALVRDLEADPGVCRKHVLWPSDTPDRWHASLDRVTCLSLGPLPAAGHPPHPPSPATSEREVLARLLDLGYRKARASYEVPPARKEPRHAP